MMETDIAVGSSIRAVVGRETRSRLSLVSRATSARGAVQVLGGVLLRASNGLLELEATDMELSLRTSVPATIEGEGRSSSRRSCSATSFACCRQTGGDARVPAGGRRRVDRVGLVLGSPERVRSRGLPTAASVDVPLHDRAPSLLDGASAVARGVPRRVPAGAHRHPRPLRGLAPDDGGDGLVPDGGEGDGALLRRAGARGDHPRPGARRLARVAAGAEHVQLGVNENHVVFGAGDAWLTTRRIDGQFPNVAQLKPETFDVESRSTGARCSRRFAGPRSWRSATRPAPALRGGRADDLGPEPGRRRDPRVARGQVRESRSRSGSTPSSCARASSRSRRTRWSSSSSTRSGPAS